MVRNISFISFVASYVIVGSLDIYDNKKIKLIKGDFFFDSVGYLHVDRIKPFG